MVHGQYITYQCPQLLNDSRTQQKPPSEPTFLAALITTMNNMILINIHLQLQHIIISHNKNLTDIRS